MVDRVYNLQLAKPKFLLRYKHREKELCTQDVPCDTKPIEFTVVAGTPIPRFEYTMAFSQEALQKNPREEFSFDLTVTCLSPRPVVVLFPTHATQRRTPILTPRSVRTSSVSILLDDLTDPLIPSIDGYVSMYVPWVQYGLRIRSGPDRDTEVLFPSGGKLTLAFRMRLYYGQRFELGHAYWLGLNDEKNDIGFQHWRYANDDEICGLPRGFVVVKELHRPLVKEGDYSSTEAIQLQNYLASFHRNDPIVFESVLDGWGKTGERYLERAQPMPLFKLPRELRNLIYQFLKYEEGIKGFSFRVHDGKRWEVPAALKMEERKRLETVVYRKSTTDLGVQSQEWVMVSSSARTIQN
ncbi:MAG: hypothetical protein Q9167_001472 [Letrouitia subvulpina]